ncbi:hypothetical protein H0H92_004187 [Tricholoma furcatifolium]|nr:hypothetical protein H0H92_004187 [Tricholoma furcatifolium]
MPRSEREDVLAALSARIFSAMVSDLVMDAALQAHQEVSRSRTLCPVCNTCCSAAHAPGPSSAISHSNPAVSRAGTPASTVDAKLANNNSGTGTNTPTSVKDGNLYMECVNCSRQIASNRPSSDAGRSVSPPSDAGAASDGSPKGKVKAKSVSKRAEDAEFNLKRKRPASPQVSPAKNQKKQKTSGSPVSRLKAESEASIHRNNVGFNIIVHFASHELHQSHFSPSKSQSKIPSKLRDSSTAPRVGRSSNSTSSRESSPGGFSAATPASSSFSRSPHIANKKAVKGKPKVNGVGPPKRPSPPRPPPIHVPDYSLGETDIVLKCVCKVVDNLVDVEGEETGSSTDTDSS